MSIRTRVHLFQLIIGVSVVMVAATVYVTLYSTAYYLERVEWANRQLDAVTALRVNANRFSEQIAEFLLIGEPERVDLESARAELEGGFANLEATTRGELEFLAGRGERTDDLDELFRLERMRTLYEEINKAVARVYALREQGRQDEAILMFRREIENRLDAEFETLLTSATLDEQEEVLQVERQAETLWWRLTLATALVTLAAVATSVILGVLLLRSLMRPIRLLTSGAEAISRGELDHRIAYDSGDELGLLARRFNDMAAQQEEQRDLLLRARTNLEAQVAERTRELAAANRRLTEIDQSRLRFLAEISHELRTPLTVLYGEADITLRHGSKPEAVYRDTLERIMAQASDMSRLVEDLLFLARSETDTIRFEPQRVALKTLMAAAVRDGEALAEAKSIAVHMECASDPVWIHADARRLKQALVILVENAIKYSPPERAIWVRMTAANRYGEVAVRDEGIGIPAEELPHVFDRFYRGRTSGASGRDGSGLGLAIAKWIVERHGGEIAIASEEGSYTEVRIRVPREEVTSFDEDPARGG